MGTRNSTLVKLNGELKVAQYGQWDGYPTGQGATIQDFLKEVDLPKFKEEVAKLRELTDEEVKEVEADKNWTTNYPYLSRDAGAGILQMIADGQVKFVVLGPDFREDTLFCEYWYELDLDKETITMNGRTFTFDEWRDIDLEKLENEGGE